MNILAVGPARMLGEALRRLQGVRVLRAHGVDSAEAVLRRERIALVILDPRDIRYEAFRRFIDGVAGLGVALALYVDLSSSSGMRIVYTARAMPVAVVIEGAEDEAQAVARVVAARGEPSVLAMFVSAIAENLARAPAAVADLLTAHLAHGKCAALSVDRFAQLLRVDVSTLRRWLRGCGLGSPSRVLGCLRVAASCTEISHSGGQSISRIAHGFGWSERSMRHKFKTLLGQSPRDAGRAGQRDRVVQCLRDMARQ